MFRVAPGRLRARRYPVQLTSGSAPWSLSQVFPPCLHACLFRRLPYILRMASCSSVSLQCCARFSSPERTAPGGCPSVFWRGYIASPLPLVSAPTCRGRLTPPGIQPTTAGTSLKRTYPVTKTGVGRRGSCFIGAQQATDTTERLALSTAIAAHRRLGQRRSPRHRHTVTAATLNTRPGGKG